MRYRILSAMIIIGFLCAGCDVGTKGSPENKGLYNCENKINGAKVRFDPEKSTVWMGTNGPRLEFIDLISGQELMIEEKQGWVCIDGAGKEHAA